MSLDLDSNSKETTCGAQPVKEALAVDLGESKDACFLNLFDTWCIKYAELASQLESKVLCIKEMKQNLEQAKSANDTLKEECQHIQKAVSQCQQHLHLITELEGESRKLKMQLDEKEEEVHKNKTQYETDIRSLKTSLSQEHKDHLDKTKSEYDEKLRELQSLLESEQESKTAIELRLSNTIRDKDREIAKISKEYESKLASAERQKAQYMQQQQQMLNQDIMRKKMQHMKECHEKELASLRSQLLALQGATQKACPAAGQRYQAPAEQHHQQGLVVSSGDRHSIGASPRQRQPLFASKVYSTGQSDRTSLPKSKDRDWTLSVCKRSF